MPSCTFSVCFAPHTPTFPHLVAIHRVLRMSKHCQATAVKHIACSTRSHLRHKELKCLVDSIRGRWPSRAKLVQTLCELLRIHQCVVCTLPLKWCHRVGCITDEGGKAVTALGCCKEVSGSERLPVAELPYPHVRYSCAFHQLYCGALPISPLLHAFEHESLGICALRFGGPATLLGSIKLCCGCVRILPHYPRGVKRLREHAASLAINHFEYSLQKQRMLRLAHTIDHVQLQVMQLIVDKQLAGDGVDAISKNDESCS
mmetsp:Transcript_72391/g.172510  ORF Transcript_72391/g.172510 Transcript_72391/m.172510 type:complete len:259 (-) Transcript_72391:668-1444(-)